MSLFGSFGGAKTNAFGQTVNPQQPQQNVPPSSGFGAFGQQQQQSSTPSTGTGFGIFGAANNSNNTTTAQPTAAPSAFSGFGTSTSAFGSSTLGQQQQQPQQNQQSQPSPFSWGGFGTNNNTSAVNPTTAGTTTASGTSALGQTSTSPFSAFGLNQSTLQQSQPSSTNLFGSLSTQTQQQQPQSQAPTNSIFGSSNIFGQNQSTQPSNTGFGVGIPAQQQQQQQPQQSAFGQSQVQPSNQSVTKASKFNDLPDSAKNALENVDAFIQKFVQISTELKTMRLGEEAEKTSKLLAEIVPITQGVANIIVSDEDVTQDLRSKVDDITRDEVTAIQIIDGLRDPNKSVNLQAHAGFPLEYYTKLTHRLIERLQTYKNTVDAIERKLVSMSENHQRSPQAISGTLRAQHATFMALATRVAELEATLNKIRQAATAAWRAQTGSARNPFDPQFDVANALNASIYGSR